jgi:hypothetical protein
MKAILKMPRRVLLAATVTLLAVGIFTLYFITKANDKSSPHVTQKMSQADFVAEKQLLEQELRRKGAAGMVGLLKQKMAGNASVARECHPLLHHMGHAAYDHYGSFAEAMAHQDEFCNSGFTHGIIEAAFLENDDWLETMQLVCPADGENTNNYRQWQCYHGVGHGIMYAQGRDVTKSLAGCEALPTDTARASCANGAFMEKFIVVDHMGQQRKNTPDHTFCGTQPAKYKPDCYLYAPTAHLQKHPNAYTQAFNICSKVEKTYERICAQGVAGQIMKDNIAQPTTTAMICADAARRLRTACAQGAISMYISHYASSSKAKKLCGNEFKAFKSACETAVEEKRKLLDI